MTFTELANRLEVKWCSGGCGLSTTKHREGCIDPFGVIHFAERRFTRRSARNFLILVARMDRESDPGFLNIDLYDWFYVYLDSVDAARMAKAAGFRLPAPLFDAQRQRCRDLAARRGVKLSKYRKVWNWAHD
jgi:hypothetical protein